LHWLELDEVDSTQNVVIERLKADEEVGVVFAHHQSGGRGRFGRIWASERGASLTMSIAFHDCRNEAQPWLAGMRVACACAGLFGCQVRWPNDLVVGSDFRKLGGILTELCPTPIGMVPVVGIGINLLPGSIRPEFAKVAASWKLAGPVAALELAGELVKAIELIRAPATWAELEPYWTPYDATAGKQYKLPTGEVVTAIRLGEQGELIATSQAGEVQKIMAAEALFGPSTAG
jgi:BirA family biotin operon repressor/biotin-[acetyl-CoA-carboxylase] ligase